MLDSHGPTFPAHHQAPDPRATRLHLPAHTKVSTEIWLGGAHTDLGEVVLIDNLSDAWLVDLAGELPLPYRHAAGACFLRVFSDVESVPSSIDRILALARDLALRVAGSPFGTTKGTDSLPPGLPARLYVMCSQGFNRSALFAGFLLRELGVSPAEAIERIRSRRPGSLTNATFVSLLLNRA